MRDYQVYLEDIIGAIDSIEAYTKGLTFEGFAGDKKTVDAVIRNFEVIGEATKNVPLAVRREYPKGALARYGGNERQVNPRILRRSARGCLENSKRAFT